ncbi:MAG: hypothetical protein IKX20_11145 [Paludibacteraceae bacterium]|nr:hypothetical protein [Paludibacteraceae bacterium]
MARLEMTINEAVYRNYLTDTLYYYVHNQALNVRFADLMDDKKKKQRNKTGDEIVADLVKNAGIVLR